MIRLRLPSSSTLVAAPLLLLLGGCVGTDVGNPAEGGEGEFAFSAETSSFVMPGGLMVAGVQVDEAWINIESIELRSDCSRNNAEVIEGPFLVDLLSPNSIPVVFQDPEYCSMRFQLAPIEEVAGEGLTLRVRGMDSEGREFSVESDKPDTVRFVGRGQKIDTSSDTNRFVVNLPMFDWIATGGLADIAAPVEISERSNVNELQAFSRAYQDQSRMFKDQDKSGAIEPDESAPVGIPDPN